MAISGSWKAANSFSATARKWGTGINPVHSINTMGDPLRSSEVTTMSGPNAPGPRPYPAILADPGEALEWHFGPDEDYGSDIWGYGYDTGTADRPNLGTETQDFRGTTPGDYPSPGYHQGGIPGGNSYRAKNHGGRVTDKAKLGYKNETVTEGWRNKTVDGVEDSETSNVAQYERQTSMQQRDQVRAGSQNPNSGTASEYKAPIGSWRPTWGQRQKPWSGGQRHYDMFPFQADQLVRPFLNRQAGTGYREWLAANEAYNYQVHPLQRQPVPDPYAGVPVPQYGNVFEEESYPVQSWVNVWY